jgi:hypothetical protein
VNGLERFLPAFEPALALSLLVGYLWARVARIRVILGAATVASVIVILALTLSPSGALPDEGTLGVCNLAAWRPETLELFGIGEDTLNIALFAPLGFVLAFYPTSRTRSALIAAALGLPFAIEITQLLVTSLGRYCDSMDVADNLIGLVLGFASGAIVVTLTTALRHLVSRARSAEVRQEGS